MFYLLESKKCNETIKRHHFVELAQPNNFCWDVIKALDKIEQKDKKTWI